MMQDHKENRRLIINKSPKILLCAQIKIKIEKVLVVSNLEISGFILGGATWESPVEHTTADHIIVCR